MFKLSTTALVVCAGAVTAIPAAKAADMHQPIPRVVMKGWYLRGDIGYSNQMVDSLDNALYATYDFGHQRLQGFLRSTVLRRRRRLPLEPVAAH